MGGTGPVSGHTRQRETARDGECETVCVRGTVYRCCAMLLVQGLIFISPDAAETQGFSGVPYLNHKRRNMKEMIFIHGEKKNAF